MAVRLLGFMLILLAIGVALTPSSSYSVAAEPTNLAKASKPLPPSYSEKVAPLVRTYCLNCHQGAKPKGGLDLSVYGDEAAALKAPKVWEKVEHNVRTHEMPPKGKPQPTAQEIAVFTAWFEGKIATVNCGGKPDPGRVTLRRLNRVEYDNTIRDLIGVDFHPANDFPVDDVGYGFDNIGDVLSMPPILMEKYLVAAEKILDKAIVTEERIVGQSTKIVGKQLASSPKFRLDDRGFRALITNGEVSASFPFSKPGEYFVRVRAFGDQAGKEPARMALRVGDREEKIFDVPVTRDHPTIYSVRLKLEAGEKKVVAKFLNDFYDPKEPNPERRDRNLYVEYLETQGPLEAPGSLPESHRRIFFRQPGDKLTKEQCAREILERFAVRAYRRPLRNRELDRLLHLVSLAESNGDSFEQGIRLALKAVLVSPYFLFRVEMDAPLNDPNNVRGIDDHELATRLSYFLWSSMPDEVLFAEANAHTLRKNLDAQVIRMLRDPKARALVDNFAGQWLQTRSVQRMTPDHGRFPGFDEELRSAMVQETVLFVEAIVKEDRSILDFIDADFTFVNERLARHYGMPDVKGKEFRKVPLQGGQRGGVLTQASVLLVTSNPTRTSPVKRGKWILENILGTPPAPPPPDAGELSEDKAVVLSGSLRQRMERHRSKAICASCHERMDPLGFAFENFDAVGAWRTKDGTFDIDSSGVLPGGRAFKGPSELKVILKSKKEDFARCLSEKLLTYALGRGLEYPDKCAVDRLVAALNKNEYKFSSLVVAIVHSAPFQLRRGLREKP